MDFIIETIVKAVEWFRDLFIAIFVSVWDLLTDVVCWVVDEALTFAVGAMNAIDTAPIQQAVGAWGQLPGDVLNILGLLGFGTCMGIISSAIVIRLILQLIPFVRLGS